MLNSMRNIKGNWLMKLLLLMLAITFVSFYGISQNRGCNSEQAALVNGDPISLRELMRNYHMTLKRLDQSGMFKGGAATPEIQKYALLSTLQEMINLKLLLQESQKSGVVVARMEAAKAIKQQEYFQDPKTKKFDPQQYEMVITRSLGIPTQEYERLMVQDMTLNRFQGLLRALSYAPETEAKEQYVQNNETVDLHFATLAENALAKPPAAPSETELKKFFDSNAESFKTAEKRTFTYLALPANKPAASEPPSSGAGAGVTKEKTADPKAAQELRRQALRAADFRKFAQEAKWNGQAIAMKEAGPLAENGRIEGDDSYPLIRQAFKLKKVGDLSEPMEGWSGTLYLVRLDALTAPRLPAFAEVQAEVLSRWQEKQQAQALAQQAKETFTSLQKARDPLAVAKAQKLKLQQTGAFKRSDSGYVPKIGSSQELSELAFALSKEKPFPPRPVEIERKQVIFWLKDKKAADLGQFEKMKRELLETARQERSQRLFTAWLEQLREQNRETIVINQKNIAQAFPDLFPNDV